MLRPANHGFLFIFEPIHLRGKLNKIGQKKQPKTVDAEQSKFQNLGEKPRWSRPGHVIERNLEAQAKKPKV